MNFHIIIPAHNEEDSIAKTLESLANQSLLPKKVVVVNDHSSDGTQGIVEAFASKYAWLSLVNNASSNAHLPGSKIINAFYKAYGTLDEDYDVICKFDADLIFPKQYLEQLAAHFSSNPKLGMAAGFCYIEKDGTWVLENLTRKDHIRGALKAYRKQCFLDIGKLKPSMGWDTVDELLAQFYGWELMTDDSLKVKHLKPTGMSYNKASKYLQGEAMYKMRYGFSITLISAVKLAYKKNSFKLFKDYLAGYFRAKNQNVERLVTEAQGKFIRKLRWDGMKEKFRN
ncbi:glycosyltransferase family 2 protein [Subsaximicrobium wynnwilliamsii]|uniref:Glycosyltransferase family 2 protein n=1 Tax=Subsaximicrobium wynnwilliamsii TaxID=291179 RepID=A0A5C6ZG04_9FLAO|nr:glycosyltransferase family 2 protein [Subsaximicrobium wynnwilliamsii]TXD82836.1 glycosyltransferase family 2 protein [Subsaximicrobium wynnwilliamsii]TXD88558.1 glycosyltransferase family 2 protein [Subsaximicrobium wynnwilliamsii]TXE02445.1 glycosyltransferase family 2 protein [Subsaximicrobium wynnwilliamsii]